MPRRRRNANNPPQGIKTRWLYCRELMQSTCQWLMLAMLLFFAYQSFEDLGIYNASAGIGYLVLMAEAIIVHCPMNPLTKDLDYETKRLLHLFLEVSGLMLAFYGQNGKLFHFRKKMARQTVRIGFMSMVFSVFGGLFGIVNYLAANFYVELVHGVFSQIVYTLGMVAVYSDYDARFNAIGLEPSWVIIAFSAIPLAFFKSFLSSQPRVETCLVAAIIIGISYRYYVPSEVVTIISYVLTMIGSVDGVINRPLNL